MHASRRINKFQLSSTSVWGKTEWCVTEMKSFLEIISMSIIQVPDIKDRWSSEWITKFFSATN